MYSLNCGKSVDRVTVKWFCTH